MVGGGPRDKSVVGTEVKRERPLVSNLPVLVVVQNHSIFAGTKVSLVALKMGNPEALHDQVHDAEEPLAEDEALPKGQCSRLDRNTEAVQMRG